MNNFDITNYKYDPKKGLVDKSFEESIRKAFNIMYKRAGKASLPNTIYMSSGIFNYLREQFTEKEICYKCLTEGTYPIRYIYVVYDGDIQVKYRVLKTKLKVI